MNVKLSAVVWVVRLHTLAYGCLGGTMYNNEHWLMVQARVHCLDLGRDQDQGKDQGWVLTVLVWVYVCVYYRHCLRHRQRFLVKVWSLSI